MATQLQDPKESDPYNPENRKKSAGSSSAANSHEFALPRENSVYDQEKQGSRPATGRDDIGPGHDRAAGDPSDPRGELGSAEKKAGGGFYNPKGESAAKAEGRDSLKKSEGDSQEEDDSDEGGLYNDEGGSKKKKGRGRFRITRKRGAILGFGGAGIVTVLFGIFSVASGPFEFVHIAQLLINGNLSNQQDASDQEMGKEYRYLRSGGDVGETRLTALESRMKTNMISQLKDVGIVPTFDKNGVFDGFNADSAESDSIFHKAADEEDVKNILADNGVDPSTFDVSIASDGSFRVTPKTQGFFSRQTDSKGLNKFFVSQAKESKIPDALRWRVLNKYGLVGWHPFVRAKNAVNQKAAEAAAALWEKAIQKFQSTGQGSDEVDATGAKETTTETNPDGTTTTTTTDAPSDVGSTDATKTSKILGSIRDSKGLKVTGGVAAGVGLLCTLNTVKNNFGAIRYVQNMLPLTRMGSTSLVEGQQVMANNDEDLNEMGQESAKFTDSDGQSWSSAQTFQADSGEAQTGVDMDQGVKDSLSEAAPSWLSWVGSVPAIGALCSGVGTVVTGIVSVGISLFSGDLAGPALGFAAAPLTGSAVDKLSHLLAGDAVNVAKDTGPKWGNDVNYGAKLLANAGAVQDGGTQLSGSQVAELDGQENAVNKATFSSKSLAYRIFSPGDYRSLISQFIDKQNPNVGQNLQNVATEFMGFGHTLGSLPNILLSSVVHADGSGASTYQYPFPSYGFSQEDLDNPAVQDPYANADYVATNLLDKNGQDGVPDYITKAQKCFNVSITKGADGWDAIPGASSDPEALNLYDPQNYSPSDCQDTGNTDWLRIRFFIFDTGLMEGYACEHGDDQSCQNDGFGGGASTSGGGTTTTTDPTTPIGGSGTGKFTTNTSVTYPGLQQMLARVSAATSSASGAASFCASISGCSGKCESAVEMAWLGHRGQYLDPFGSAGDTPAAGSAWAAALASGHAHPGDRNPPAGALLIYNSHNPSDPFGHITIYLGNNQVFSTDFDHQGSVGIDPASDIESGIWAKSYVGWMDPYFSGKVGT